MIKKVITLPLSVDLETKVVLKQLALAHRRLGELKGVSKTIPNQTILINTLPLLEAKDSSAIENIITTHDEVFREGLFEDLKLSRQTASKYLEELSGEGLLQKEKIGKSNFYINQSLFELLRNR